MFLRQIFLFLCGLSFGLLSSAGVFTGLVSVGLIPRFAGKMHVAKKVFALEEDIKQTVPLNRIMQGQNFSDDETVTSVELAYHKYVPTEEEIEAYNGQESGGGYGIFVLFNEPLRDLSITYKNFPLILLQK